MDWFWWTLAGAAAILAVGGVIYLLVRYRTARFVAQEVLGTVEELASRYIHEHPLSGQDKDALLTGLYAWLPKAVQRTISPQEWATLAGPILGYLEEALQKPPATTPPASFQTKI